ncbi:MAG: hypothetical protein O7H41_13500 [Planctomycetota bacterium]|nr:hypothetical protein [Planctomycetota bacterium]
MTLAKTHRTAAYFFYAAAAVMIAAGLVIYLGGYANEMWGEFGVALSTGCGAVMSLLYARLGAGDNPPLLWRFVIVGCFLVGTVLMIMR